MGRFTAGWLSALGCRPWGRGPAIDATPRSPAAFFARTRNPDQVEEKPTRRPFNPPLRCEWAVEPEPSLTAPFKTSLKGVEADEGAGECGEGMVDVEPAFVADGQAAEAVDPGEYALDDPPVLAQPLAAFDAAACDRMPDAAPEAGAAAAAMIIGLIGVQCVRPASGSPGLSCNRWHRVEQVLEGPAVVSIGTAQQEGERDAASVGDEVALGACLASVRRVRPRSGAPLFAAMDALSMQARLQSIRSA